MNYKNILITGGAGFVGSNLAVMLKQEYPGADITVLDNLSRRGSELNISRLKKNGINFIWGDVRNEKDLAISTDLLIECSAEPSVMAGVDTSPSYLIETNLLGAINCLEIVRRNKADIIFLSTSRVYPIVDINNLKFKELKTRFDWLPQKKVGFSKKGISEDFPLGNIRSMYGATKLSAEFLISEYISNYKIQGVINRCGVISGPWQMGKVDQGVVMLWLAAHYFKKDLSYVGYGGSGKQVRDILNINDLFDLIKYEMNHMKKLNGKILNAGGGYDNSASLLELTYLCEKITGNSIRISKDPKTRVGDIRIYITDNSKVTALTSWSPMRNVEQTLNDIFLWVKENESALRDLF